MRAKELADAIGARRARGLVGPAHPGRIALQPAIDHALKDAEAVVVLWSETSVEFGLGPGRGRRGPRQRAARSGTPRRLQGAARIPAIPVGRPIPLERRRGRGARRLCSSAIAKHRDAGAGEAEASTASAKAAAREPVLDLRAAVRQHERRSRTGIFQRRHHRGHHHRSCRRFRRCWSSPATPRSPSRAR